jgi:hypothetical protein
LKKYFCFQFKEWVAEGGEGSAPGQPVLRLLILLAPGLLLAPLLGLLLAHNLGFLNVPTVEVVSSFGVDIFYFLIPGEDYYIRQHYLHNNC